MGDLPFPHGHYDLYPKGWAIVRTDPPIMDAFDELEVGRFLAWCLTNAETLLPQMEEAPS